MLDKTKKDYDSLLEETKRYVTSIYPDWTDFLESDIGYAMIKTFVALSDFNNYYLDRQIEEAFLKTCKSRTSAAVLAKSLGYEIKEIQPSKCVVEFSIPSPLGYTAEIPKNTMIMCSGLEFYTVDTAYLLSGAKSTTVNVIQGKYWEQNLLGSGLPWQEYQIPDELGDIKVILGEEKEINQVKSFIYTTGYKIVHKSSGRFIQFGIDSIPKSGESILIYGSLSRGSKGNLSGTQTFSITSFIGGSGNSNLAPLFLGKNITPITGGRDYESVDDIKKNAPEIFATQERAVTADDYKALAESVPGVVSASVKSGSEIGRYGEVFIIVQADSNGVLEDVRSVLNQKKMVTMRTSVIPPQQVYVDLKIDIQAQNESDFPRIREQATISVIELLKNASVGTSIRGSDIIYLIKRIGSIVSVNLDFMARVKIGSLEVSLIDNVDLNSVLINETPVNPSDISESEILKISDESLYGNLVSMKPIGSDLMLKYDQNPILGNLSVNLLI